MCGGWTIGVEGGQLVWKILYFLKGPMHNKKYYFLQVSSSDKFKTFLVASIFISCYCV